MYVSAQIINDIDEQTRQNILIKKKILTHLPLSRFTNF